MNRFLIVLCLVSAYGCADKVTSRGSKGQLVIDSQILNIPQRNRLASLSPDGAHVAYDFYTDGRDVVRIRNVVSGEETEFYLDNVDLRSPNWAPDGESILISARQNGVSRQLQYFPDSGESKYLTPPGMSASRGDWHPDGTKLAYVNNSSGNYDIYIFDIKTGLSSRITDNTGSEYWPSWSPSGDAITFYNTWNEWTNLAVVDVATGEISELTTNTHEDYRPVFSSDGQGLYFMSDRWEGLGIGYYDFATGQIRNVAPEINHADYVTVLGDGTGVFHALQLLSSAYESNSDGTIVTIDPQEADRTKPALNPDKSLLVYAAWRDDARQIFSYNLETSEVKQITDTRHLYDSPIFTSDGRLWALRSGGDFVHSRLGLLDFETGQFTQIDDSPSTRYPVSCGAHIYFLSADVGYQDNMTLTEFDYANRSTRPVSDEPLNRSGITCGPGNTIIGSSVVEGDLELVTVDIASGRTERVLALPGDQLDPELSVDGGEIVFATRESNAYSIATHVLGTDEVKIITTEPGVYRYPIWLEHGAVLWVKETASTRWVISKFE